MDIIFTWVNYGRFSQGRKLCIERAREVYPDSNIIFITDSPDVVPEFAEFKSINSIKHHLIRKFGVDPKRLLSPYGLTDYVKFWYLAFHPNTLYLDTDTYSIKKIPKIKKGKLASIPGQISVIYNNNKEKFFERLIPKWNNSSTLVKLEREFDYENSFVDVSKCFVHKPKELEY